MKKTAAILAVLLAARFAAAAAVSDAEMRQVYDAAKTPFKYGVVIAPPKGMLADSPSVFSKDGKWHMFYVLSDGDGYSTHIAQSDNLLDWHYKGEVLARKNNSDWDGQQSAGYAALQNIDWNGDWSLGKFAGKYWMSYLGGALKGYETDPLAIGIAFTKNLAAAAQWSRLPLPALSPKDSGARYFEKLTLYKSNIIADEKRLTGARFAMFYNAKTESGYERIAMAVSDDMISWRRYGDAPVIDAGGGISGDPQVVKMGDLYVMFYFNAFCKGAPAGVFDTFAASRDHVHWTDWRGEPLVKPSEGCDKNFAHKPHIINHNGVVYHFYCAVGDQGRVIALATSKDLRKK